MSLLLAWTLACSFLALAMAQMNFFAASGEVAFDNPVSSACSTALNSTLQCESRWTMYPNNDFAGPFNTTELDGFCAPMCTSSLAAYSSHIETSCKNDRPFEDIHASFVAERMIAYQNRTCLKDKTTGDYCNVVNGEWQAALPDRDFALAELPRANLCSYCFLALLQAIQSTPYSNYDESFVEQYKEAQAVCGVNYPTDVKPWPFNVTEEKPVGVITSTDGTPVCLSGKMVTVTSGQSCQGIAAENNVAKGTLRLINNIFPDCSNLAAGASLCLPLSCTTYVVQPGDTCFSIASAKGTNFRSIVSYNPSLNQDCSNLLADENICVSPPGGTFTPTTIAGAGVATSAVYATATATPPSPIARGTTRKCGKYYTPQSGDTCQQISLNATITLSLFTAINPAIDSSCSNLSPGLYYCVQPTADWNATTSDSSGGSTTRTTASAPGPTPSGSSDACYEWYTVVSGDYCYLLTQSYGITMAQLVAWNPALKDDCSNLAVGQAYCVDGPAASPAMAKRAVVGEPTQAAVKRAHVLKHVGRHAGARL